MRYSALALFACCFALPEHAEAQYTYSTSSGQGPFYDIPNYERDLESRTYAAAFWDCEHGNGCSPYYNFAWQHHVEQSSPLVGGGEAGHHIAPFAEGYATFSFLYRHRMLSTTGAPVVDIQTLIETDDTVRRVWQFFTLHRQVVTVRSIDPIAYDNHLMLITEALAGDTGLRLRGVLQQTADVAVSDRLVIEDWERYSATPTTSGLTLQGDFGGSGSTPDDGGSGGSGNPPGAGDPVTTDSQACDELLAALATTIANNATSLADIERHAKNHASDGDWGSRLYEKDVNPSDTDGDGAINPESGQSGFDCDDFVTALGNLIDYRLGQQGVGGDVQFKGATVTYEKAAGEPIGHQLLTISVCGKYWMIDAQTGGVSGPNDAGDDKAGSAREAMAGYSNANLKSLVAGKEYAINDRPDIEPPPWHEDPDQKQRFERILQHFAQVGNTTFPDGAFLP